MGPRILRKRKPDRKTGDEPRILSHRGSTTEAEVPTAGGRDQRQQKGTSQVTHRSPSPDDNLLPCCGRPLSQVQGKDRITTDPTQVTCGT
jgi:hypothetical protein